MFFEEIGDFLCFFVVLVAVFLFSNLWFYFVEAMVGRVKKFLNRCKKAPAWHPLPKEKEERKND
jgi:hypothetical protein